MDCATIVKRGYLYDKKMGLLPVTTVSERERGRVREREREGVLLSIVLHCLFKKAYL